MWPRIDFFKDVERPSKTNLVEKAIILLTEIRGAKTQAQKNMKHPVQNLTLRTNKEDNDRIESIIGDLINAGSIENYSVTIEDQKEEIETEVVLAP